jgi:hypothetical protein
LTKVSDWLKVLIKETGLPFLVVGIEDTVEQILDVNPQLSRLFAAREELEPFAWDLADKTCVGEFAQFVTYAEVAIGVTLPNDLPRMELLYRLHYATAGVVGNLMNLLRFAALIAQEKKIDTLDLATLALAFDRRLSRHLKVKTNPFRSTTAELSVTPSFTPEAERTPTGHGHGEQQAVSLAEVLTTR